MRLGIKNEQVHFVLLSAFTIFVMIWFEPISGFYYLLSGGCPTTCRAFLYTLKK